MGRRTTVTVRNMNRRRGVLCYWCWGWSWLSGAVYFCCLAALCYFFPRTRVVFCSRLCFLRHSCQGVLLGYLSFLSDALLGVMMNEWVFGLVGFLQCIFFH